MTLSTHGQRLYSEILAAHGRQALIDGYGLPDDATPADIVTQAFLHGDIDSETPELS